MNTPASRHDPSARTARGLSHAPAEPQSEFRAFLDDLTQLVRGPRAEPAAPGGLGAQLHQARHRVDEALGSVQQSGAAATEQVRRGIDQSRAAMAERPLQTLVAALVAGLVVGLALSRRA